MAFNDKLVQLALIRAKYACEACGKDWYDLFKSPKDSPIDLHSATSLHLIRIPETVFFEVTSQPAGLVTMKNRPIKAESFLFYKEFGRDDDGFCLCNKCHRMVHYIAEIESRKRIKNKNLKNAIPSVLDEVTVMYILSNGIWRPN